MTSGGPGWPARGRRLVRAVGQARHNFVYNLRYAVNDAYYWNRYVRNWEESEEAERHAFLGNEWRNEEVFLGLLERHASRGHTALEIGCGGGRITASAVELFDHVHACDPAREMLRKTRESVAAANLTLHELDGFTLAGFADASVDFVFSHDVFVHFSSLQVLPYLREIERVLRPGGTGLVSFYDFSNSFDLFESMSMDFWAQRRFPPHMRVHFLTEEMLHRLLERAGFEIIEVDRANFLIGVFRKP